MYVTPVPQAIVLTFPIFRYNSILRQAEILPNRLYLSLSIPYLPLSVLFHQSNVGCVDL